MTIFQNAEDNVKIINEVFIGEIQLWICHECGVTANILTCLRNYKAPPKKLCYDVSTYWVGECSVCGETKQVTSERDFFYPDFSLLQKNWILKLKK